MFFGRSRWVWKIVNKLMASIRKLKKTYYMTKSELRVLMWSCRRMNSEEDLEKRELSKSLFKACVKCIRHKRNKKWTIKQYQGDKNLIKRQKEYVKNFLR